MSANDVQVGGDHYQKGELQHWDVITEHGVCYLLGNASKYLLRWRDKNGLQDLRKALHYVQKTREMVVRGHLLNMLTMDPVPEQKIGILARNHRLTEPEEKILRLMLGSLILERTMTAEKMLEALIRHEEKREPGTPEDGGHHSRQEES